MHLAIVIFIAVFFVAAKLNGAFGFLQSFFFFFTVGVFWFRRRLWRISFFCKLNFRFIVENSFLNIFGLLFLVCQRLSLLDVVFESFLFPFCFKSEYNIKQCWIISWVIKNKYIKQTSRRRRACSSNNLTGSF